MKRVNYREGSVAFETELPPEWVMESDPEGGVSIFDPGQEGLLHLLPFERETAEPADPAEELYAFLYDQEIELEEDEIEDIELGESGELALCGFTEEPEEEEGEEEEVFWLMGVASAPAALLFASFSCPLAEAGALEPIVRRILSTLRFL